MTRSVGEVVNVRTAIDIECESRQDLQTDLLTAAMFVISPVLRVYDGRERS